MLTLYFSLMQRILPLFLYGLLGYLLGKRTRIQQRTLATLLFYYIVPLVLFSGTLQAELSPSLISLPILIFGIGSLLCFTTLKWAGMRWKDGTANILAFAAGTANSGYFGLPIALALFSPQGVSTFLFAVMGMTLYESSVGFFVAALGRSTLRQAVVKVLALPTLWAFLLGIISNLMEITLPASLLPIDAILRTLYSCLGMMVIGLGLAQIKNFSIDWPYLRAAFAIRYLPWPLITIALYAADSLFLHFYGQELFQTLLLIAIVPLPANMVVIASLCNLEPEKAATAVALSLGTGLLFLPLIASLIF